MSFTNDEKYSKEKEKELTAYFHRHHCSICPSHLFFILSQKFTLGHFSLVKVSKNTTVIIKHKSVTFDPKNKGSMTSNKGVTFMSPVSSVFHTEAKVSFGLKNVLRVGTSIK